MENKMEYKMECKIVPSTNTSKIFNLLSVLRQKLHTCADEGSKVAIQLAMKTLRELQKLGDEGELDVPLGIIIANLWIHNVEVPEYETTISV